MPAPSQITNYHNIIDPCDLISYSLVYYAHLLFLLFPCFASSEMWKIIRNAFSINAWISLHDAQFFFWLRSMVNFVRQIFELPSSISSCNFQFLFYRTSLRIITLQQLQWTMTRHYWKMLGMLLCGCHRAASYFGMTEIRFHIDYAMESLNAAVLDYRKVLRKS